VLVPNDIPTNSVLAATDILVTDYSSIFFDFLSTGRPIAFLTPDIDDYAGYRGLYFEPDEWPGTVVKSVAQLVEVLHAIDDFGPSRGIAARYEAMRERFVAREDGHATDRIIDIVFRGATAGYRIRDVATDGRTTVLINGGGMRPNGITSSLISLLNEVDHARFDVSVVFPTSRRAAVVEKQGQLSAHVRQFARVGGMNGSKLSHLHRRITWLSRNLRAHRTNPVQRRLWDDEWSRCFGNARFDEVIDFSGYGPLFATLLLHAPGAQRSIWMHNDLAADAHRRIRGRRRNLRDLSGVFSLYREYDHLVSVSPALQAINRDKLSRWAPAERFASARNLASVTTVLSNAAVPLEAALADPLTGVLPDWAPRLIAKTGVTTFVTVGRLSPEKNHARLLGAFAIVSRLHPESQLVIVGTGALDDKLKRLAAELGIADAVIFTGHQPNPAALLRASDCFVLSSDYEGQPMVILEAMMVGLPIVSVAFGSVTDAIPEGSGLIVAQTEAALAQGMIAYLDGRVPTAPFDAKAYNRAAIDEFYRAIGVGSTAPSIPARL
jgi:glycosyltransferase involved in cell wall biosynthesis